jgi:HD-GYP domain-containing protein (c-di-GMP phosphodiesterase class II)
MTSKRPYRNAMSFQQAIQEMTRCKNTQFNPQLVDLVQELYNSGEFEV